MTGRRCDACQSRLPADDPAWKRLCRECFVNRKKAEHAALAEEVGDLRARLAAANCTPSLTPTMVRALLHLCHPDKHAGSQVATRATQYLLTLKREAASAPNRV